MANEPNPPEPADFVEWLLMLAQEEKRIFQVTFGAAVMAAIVGFVIPNSFTATETLLPSQQNPLELNRMLGQVSGPQTLDLRDRGVHLTGI